MWFFVFQIEMKNEKQNSSLNFNVQLFWKSNKHLVLCLRFSIETTIKSLFLISYFTLSKRWNGTLVTHIHIGSKNFDFYISSRYSVKKVFLKISQNWQEKTCIKASFLVKLLSDLFRTPMLQNTYGLLLLDILIYFK